MRTLFLLCALGTLVSVWGHSWVACTDYRGDVNYYDETKCLAYPRYWESKRQGFLTPEPKGYHIGGDSGYNYQPGAPCNLPMGSPWSSAYTTKYTSAVYEQGKTYCLAWPTKNHAAAKCTNAYIPDTKMVVYRTGVSPGTDPTSQDVFSANRVQDNFGVHQNGQIDCLGFQRAPKFCDNTDRALATGCITIPSDQAVGHYVYQWYWEFNPGSVYTTCWDAEVVASGSGRGGGGVTGASNVEDNLTDGSTSTCRTNWGTAGPSPTPTPTPPPSTPTPPPPATPPSTPSNPSTSSISFVNPPFYISTKEGAKFTVDIKYAASQEISLTVDIVNVETWYGKGQVFLNTGSGTSKITVVVNRDIPEVPGYVLRAWIVNATLQRDWEACGQCPEKNPWTMELERRESPVLVTANSAAAKARCNSNEYTKGDIAATFFGTFILTALAGGMIYYFAVHRKKTTA